MPLIVFILFVFVWYFPVYRRQGKTDRLPRRTVPLAILSGMLPGFIVIILLQIGLGYVRKALALSFVPSAAFESFISAALVEEAVKFLTACLFIRKAEPKRKVDYVLIFGAVGLGFEITETVLLLDSVVAGVFRGVFALHIIWQFWMGLYFYEYTRAKQENAPARAKKALALSLAVPLLMHGMNDFLAFMVQEKQAKIDLNTLESAAGADSLSADETAFLSWIAVLFLFMIVEIVFQIVTYKKALKAAKESRELAPAEGFKLLEPLTEEDEK